MVKYATKVPFLNSGWVLVTKMNPKTFDFEPILYDTYEEAVENAKIWVNQKTGECVAKVIEYREDEDGQS